MYQRETAAYASMCRLGYDTLAECIGRGCLLLILVLAMVAGGCSQPAAPPSGQSITKEQAKEILVVFVNRQLAEKTYDPKGYSDPDYSPKHPYPILKTSDWYKVDFSEGRWVVQKGAFEFALKNADDALYIQASVGKYGKDPRLDACKWLMP